MLLPHRANLPTRPSHETASPPRNPCVSPASPSGFQPDRGRLEPQSPVPVQSCHQHWLNRQVARRIVAEQNHRDNIQRQFFLFIDRLDQVLAKTSSERHLCASYDHYKEDLDEYEDFLQNYMYALADAAPFSAQYSSDALETYRDYWFDRHMEIVTKKDAHPQVAALIEYVCQQLHCICESLQRVVSNSAVQQLVHHSDAQVSTPVVKREDIPLAASSSIQQDLSSSPIEKEENISRPAPGPIERAVLISTTCTKEQVIDHPDAQVKRENASFAPSNSAQQYNSRPLPITVEDDENTSYPTSGLQERAALNFAIVETRIHHPAPSATTVEPGEDIVAVVEAEEESIKSDIDTSLSNSVEQGEDTSSKPSSSGEHVEEEETTHSSSSAPSQRQRSRRRRCRPKRTRRRDTCLHVESVSTSNVGVQDNATYDRVSPDDDDPVAQVAALESLPPFDTKIDDHDHSATPSATSAEQGVSTIPAVEEEHSIESKIDTTILTSVEEGEDNSLLISDSIQDQEAEDTVHTPSPTPSMQPTSIALKRHEDGPLVAREHATDSEDEHIMDLIDQYEDTKAFARSYRRFRDRGRARRRLGARAAANSTVAPPIVDTRDSDMGEAPTITASNPGQRHAAAPDDALVEIDSFATLSDPEQKEVPIGTHSIATQEQAVDCAHAFAELDYSAPVDETFASNSAPNDSSFDLTEHSTTYATALVEASSTDDKSRSSDPDSAEVLVLDFDVPDPILPGLSKLCTDIRADISSLDNLQSEMTSTIREGLDFLQCYDADESSITQMATNNLDLPDTDDALLPLQPTDNRQITPEATFSSLDGTQDTSTFSTRDVSIISPVPDRQRLSQDQDPSHATSIVTPTVAATLDSSSSSKLQQQDETDKLCGNKCTSTFIVDTRLSTDNLKLAATIFDEDESFPDSIQHLDSNASATKRKGTMQLHSATHYRVDQLDHVPMQHDHKTLASDSTNVSSLRRFQPQSRALESLDDPDSTAIVSDDDKASDSTMIANLSITSSLDEGLDIHTSFEDTLPSDEVLDSSTSAPIKNADEVLSTDLAPDPTYFTSNSNASDPRNFTEHAPDPRATSVIVAANATY